MSSRRTEAKGKRGEQGKRSIHRDSPKNRHACAVSLGSNPDLWAHPAQASPAAPKQVRGKLRELHREAATADRARGTPS